MTLNDLTPSGLLALLNHTFALGSFKITPLDLLIAVFAFAAIRTLTSLIQRLLTRKIFPRTHLDTGLQDSIVAFIGYAGTLIAIMVALSVIGINLSSIALIAGALSVGIGFGLQNIVNNFVSGIILLIERPIKVGDWIIVSGNEGIVRHINVRSTELQTFQNASVIIPNSDLLQNAVVNWFHHNRTGRIDIPVDVDYDSDIIAVESALLNCLHGLEGIMQTPAPQVFFKDFGASGLRFELRFHIPDVGERLKISSEVRKRMFYALKEAHINIPFSVVDVHLRGQEQLLAALRGAQPKS